MRGFAVGDRLCLADVTRELDGVVRGLGFERQGALFVRELGTVEPHVAENFERWAETMVRQAADLVPVPWEDALATLLERAGTGKWILVGSAARAVRGDAAAPHDIDLVASTPELERIAAALGDLLIEPLGGEGFLGERWLRAFPGARVEGVGGMHAEVAAHVVGETTETVEWRGHVLQVARR
jgi:hypothetical protein